MTNQGVGIKISILQGSPTGTLVYQEIFNPNPQTNTNGLVSIEIGGGIPLTDTFSTIDWAAGSYFIKTETYFYSYPNSIEFKSAIVFYVYDNGQHGLISVLLLIIVVATEHPNSPLSS